ncbi:MAG: AraC family transcriptional regulator [Sphingobacteriales bacterium]|nr:MAG: AraC family transcriptional regulator [Sphingobacteriales bacterium]
MKENLLKEIIPLTTEDCYTIFTRVKKDFNFPLHYHEEFELNLILNGTGARRVIGDHIGEIDEYELVLVGPNLQHAWFTHNFKGKELTEVTIQFPLDFLDEKFLRRNQLSFIRNMFEKSVRGILFSAETAKKIAPVMLQLGKKQGFDGVLEVLSILHDLSISRNMKLLSDATFNNAENFTYNSRRIEKVMGYLNQHFDKQISLNDVAQQANMTQAAFSRFFKTKTGNNYIDSLNEIRLGHAARLLIDTNRSIAEIAYHCGFNNISNFNRLFKKKKGVTPKVFREDFAYGARVFV